MSAGESPEERRARWEAAFRKFDAFAYPELAAIGVGIADEEARSTERVESAERSLALALAQDRLRHLAADASGACPPELPVPELPACVQAVVDDVNTRVADARREERERCAVALDEHASRSPDRWLGVLHDGTRLVRRLSDAAPVCGADVDVEGPAPPRGGVEWDRERRPGGRAR